MESSSTDLPISQTEAEIILYQYIGQHSSPNSSKSGSVDYKSGNVEYKHFIACLFKIAIKIYPEMEINEAISAFLNNYIYNLEDCLSKDRK